MNKPVNLATDVWPAEAASLERLILADEHNCVSGDVSDLRKGVKVSGQFVPWMSPVIPRIFLDAHRHWCHVWLRDQGYR